MQGTDALKALHTALVDARTGYEQATRKAPDERQRAIFQDGQRLHERARGTVHHLLVGRGEQPDQSGSFMSTVNKAVVSVRAAVTGLDEHSLKAFANGDEIILQRFDEAIEANAGEGDTVEALRRDREALVELVAKMKALAA